MSWDMMVVIKCACVYMDMVDMSFFTNLIFGIP